MQQGSELGLHCFHLRMPSPGKSRDTDFRDDTLNFSTSVNMSLSADENGLKPGVYQWVHKIPKGKSMFFLSIAAVNLILLQMTQNG